LEVLHEAAYFIVFLTIVACRLHHRRILESVLRAYATCWQAVWRTRRLVVVVELWVNSYWYTELDILLLLYTYIKNQSLCWLLN